jgi:hypothetical protein
VRGVGGKHEGDDGVGRGVHGLGLLSEGVGGAIIGRNLSEWVGITLFALFSALPWHEQCNIAKASCQLHCN